jgi:DNA-binding transcriptional LysR family regulator
MDFERLRHFIALSEELHFGRGAARIGISQPQLSQSLKRLETSVGATLVERAHRNVTLTPAGQVFLEEARKAVLHAEHASRAARRVAAGEAKVLRVGFISPAICRVLPAAIRTFRHRWAGVEIRLEDMPSVDQVAQLNEGKLDIGIVDRNACDLGGLATRELYRSPLCAVVPSHWPEAGLPHIDLAALAPHDFVMFTFHRTPKLYRAIIAACEVAGFTPRIVQDATHTDTIIGLVEGQLGVSLMPQALAFIAPRGVTFVPLRDAPPDCSSEFVVAWRPPVTRSEMAFIEVLTRVCEHPPVPPAGPAHAAHPAGKVKARATDVPVQ